eukprot:7870304-Alexandrium_andersonii.AAC.1
MFERVLMPPMGAACVALATLPSTHSEWASLAFVPFKLSAHALLHLARRYWLPAGECPSLMHRLVNCLRACRVRRRLSKLTGAQTKCPLTAVYT